MLIVFHREHRDDATEEHGSRKRSRKGPVFQVEAKRTKKWRSVSLFSNRQYFLLEKSDFGSDALALYFLVGLKMTENEKKTDNRVEMIDNWLSYNALEVKLRFVTIRLGILNETSRRFKWNVLAFFWFSLLCYREGRNVLFNIIL